MGANIRSLLEFDVAAAFRLLIKLRRAEHVAVIRDGDGRHAEFFDALHQLVNAVRAV